MLGLAPATLYDWAYQRKIPVVKPSGPRGPLRFRLSTLQGLIAKWERPALRPLVEKELDGRGRAGGAGWPQAVGSQARVHIHRGAAPRSAGCARQ